MHPVFASGRSGGSFGQLRRDEAGEFLLWEGFERSCERGLGLRLLSRSGRLRRFRLLVRRAIAVPNPVAVFADLLDGAFADSAVGKTLGNRRLIFCPGVFVAVFDEEPVWFAGTRIASIHANERPPALHLLAL